MSPRRHHRSVPQPRHAAQIADLGVAATRFLDAGAEASADPVARATFAARLALMQPAEQTQAVREALRACLVVLSEDPDPLVRAALAEALRGAAAAPRDVVMRLARDREVPVAQPVLHASPVLDERDLLALVLDPPATTTRPSIAARPDLAPELPGAIIATGDQEAISVLLGNPHGALSEETLLDLIARARGEPAWHSLLASRPALPRAAILELGAFLTGEPLITLALRRDFSFQTNLDLRERITLRFAMAPREGEDEAAAAQRARILFACGLLSEAVVQGAAHREERTFTLTALQLCSGVDERVIDRVERRNDPHSLTALAARAGFSLACGQAIADMICYDGGEGAVPPRRARQRYIGHPRR